MFYSEINKMILAIISVFYSGKFIEKNMFDMRIEAVWNNKNWQIFRDGHGNYL